MRSYGYTLATVGLAMVVGWMGWSIWQDLRQLNRSFALVQTDAFHLSEHVEASIRNLTETVLRVDLRRHPDAWTAFQKESQDLLQRMRAYQPMITTPEEHELMSRVEVAFEAYLSQTTRSMNERAQEGAPSLPAPVLERVKSEALPILDLCAKLKAAEHTAQTRFMKDSFGALRWLKQLFIVSMVLLIILTGTAGAALFRGLIGPLRIQLSESIALAARHEKLASLGTLAAGVAHEIRNPLTAINIRLHSLKKNLVPKSSEEEDALVIGHEIQRLEHIVQGFLQFARPAEPELLTISADKLFARMQSLFDPKFEKTSIRLNLESVPDIWMRVDPYQIEQVLINLIQNAAECMEGQGTITLRARIGTARLAARVRPVVILEVSDTGKGMPPEVQKRIFDPFFTTKEEGTGLGLPISSRIVEKHGGVLECHSVVNSGTTFAILLPHTKPEANNESAAYNSID